MTDEQISEPVQDGQGVLPAGDRRRRSLTIGALAPLAKLRGARSLKRVIQRQAQDPLAEQILAGGVKDGDAVRMSCATAR